MDEIDSTLRIRSLRSTGCDLILVPRFRIEVTDLKSTGEEYSTSLSGAVWRHARNDRETLPVFGSRIWPEKIVGLSLAPANSHENMTSCYNNLVRLVSLELETIMPTPKVKENSRPGKKTARPAWQLQTAKARFSEVFRRARSEGPQWITRQDKEAVVMLPAEEFERLLARAKQPRSLAAFFAQSPLSRVSINWERTSDYGRKVEL